MLRPLPGIWQLLAWSARCLMLAAARAAATWPARTDSTLTEHSRRHAGTAHGSQTPSDAARPGRRAKTVTSVLTGSPSYGLPPIRSISASREMPCWSPNSSSCLRSI